MVRASNMQGYASCVPPDPFWNANRNVAETVWQRGDGATVSTRIAETVSVATGMPVQASKAAVHGMLATAAGVAVAGAARSPVLGLLAASALYLYLERDRC